MKALQRKLAQYRIPQHFQAKGMYPFYYPVASGQDTEVMLEGKSVLMFGSNSYLGLTQHPELIAAGKATLDKYGTGASGSRLMNGNLDLHDRLEEALADFVGMPAATVFSTGFQTNLGTISCLLGRNDYIIIDEKDHASIIEGCRLSFAKTLKYKHNDMASLEKMLKRTEGDHLRLIITDGVFSMEGDIACLDKIVQLAEQYDASVMIDDAHGLGVLGKDGAGTANAFGLTHKTDLIMGTFSKSLASLGGFIASDTDTINYIKHHARALLFSASMPPSAVATTLKAIEIIKREPERIRQLWDNTHYAKQCLLQNDFKIGQSASPIFPIEVGANEKTYAMAAFALNDGLYVNPVIHPAVEKGKGILRYSLMATHTKEQIDRSIDILVKNRKKVEAMTEEELS